MVTFSGEKARFSHTHRMRVSIQVDSVSVGEVMKGKDDDEGDVGKSTRISLSRAYSRMCRWFSRNATGPSLVTRPVGVTAVIHKDDPSGMETENCLGDRGRDKRECSSAGTGVAIIGTREKFCIMS